MNTTPVHLSLRVAWYLALVWLAAASGLAATNATFRVLTFNIHHGEGLDGRVDLERIARLLREQRADLVALQEVDRGTERTAKRDFPAELAALTGLTCVFSNNLSHQGGQYGNAILLRFPVKQVTNTHYRRLGPGEQRGLLETEVELDGRELAFLNTHLDHRTSDAERVASVPDILAAAERDPGRAVIVCGDFNDTPGSRMHRLLKERFDDTWERVGQGDGFTIPAEKPRKRIDYVWVLRGGPLEPVRALVIESKASDHLPVLVEFRWR